MPSHFGSRLFPILGGAATIALALAVLAGPLASPNVMAGTTSALQIPALTTTLSTPSQSPIAALQATDPPAPIAPIAPIPPATSIQSPATIAPKTSTPKISAPKPVTASATWRVLVLLYAKVDATWTDAAGKHHRINSSLRASEAAAYRAQVKSLPALIKGWSANNVVLSITIISPVRAITKLDTGCGGPYVAPWDIQADINQYAPAHSYDSIIVGWSANGTKNLAIPYWGCSPDGMYQEANGATYSTVRVPEAPWWWTNGAFGAEPFVHEWLLGVTGFFAAHGDRMPSVEDGLKTYRMKVGADGSYHTWYTAIMTGSLNAKLGPRGITKSIWRSIKPSRVK